jgi:hypothetical protein
MNQFTLLIKLRVELDKVKGVSLYGLFEGDHGSHHACLQLTVT